MPLILEGIVTTVNEDGSANISPMGPIVDRGMQQLVFRPFKTSRTYANLKRNAAGVLHVTDDVELLARAAIGKLDPQPRLEPSSAVPGWVLADACRWYAFRVQSIDDTQDRTEIQATVVDRGHIRDFFGFNRAKHAVVEAAILATRVHMLPRKEVLAQFEQLRVLVQKTGGPEEFSAFELLERHVSEP